MLPEVSLGCFAVRFQHCFSLRNAPPPRVDGIPGSSAVPAPKRPLCPPLRALPRMLSWLAECVMCACVFCMAWQAGYPPFFATGDETLFEVIKQVRRADQAKQEEVCKCIVHKTLNALVLLCMCKFSPSPPPFPLPVTPTPLRARLQGKYYFHTDAWDQISSEVSLTTRAEIALACDA